MWTRRGKSKRQRATNARSQIGSGRIIEHAEFLQRLSEHHARVLQQQWQDFNDPPSVGDLEYDAVQRQGRAVEVGSNLFLFFSSKESMAGMPGM